MTVSAKTSTDLLAEAINAYHAGDAHRAYQLYEEIRSAARHSAADDRGHDTATRYLARILADGTRATIASLARDSEPLRYLTVVQAATSHYRISGLSRGVRYCVGAATAYGPGLVVAAAPVCVTLPHRHPSTSPTREAP